MISLKRTNQGGSVATFVIVAVILAVAVIGTAYFVKQRGEQTRKDQAIAQADAAANAAKKAAQSTSAATPVSTDTKNGATADTAVAAPSNSSSTSTDTTTSSQAALPTTGPESSVAQLLAVGLLVASSGAYIASRRALDSSL